MNLGRLLEYYDVEWKDGKWVLELEGNRAVAIAAAGEEQSLGATVLVDGKKPSEFRKWYTTAALSRTWTTCCRMRRSRTTAITWIAIGRCSASGNGRMAQACGRRFGSSYHSRMEDRSR